MTSMLRSVVGRVASRAPRTASISTFPRSTASATGPHRILPFVHRPSLFTLPSSLSSPTRSISSSRPLSQATAKHHEHEPSTVSEYIDRFGGWYPLLGLGTFVLISKELFVLNEEALMVTNFAAFVFISWLVAGDIVNDAVKAKAEAIKKNHDDVSDLYIESLEQVIKAGENSLAALPLLRNLKTEYSSLGEQVIKAKEMKARAAARDTVIARLNSVYQKEQSDKAKYMTGLLDSVVAEVQQRVENLSQGDKDALLDSAIKQLGGGAQEEEDRLMRIYQEVLNEKFGQGEDTPTGGKRTQQQRA